MYHLLLIAALIIAAFLPRRWLKAALAVMVVALIVKIMAPIFISVLVIAYAVREIVTEP